MMTGATPHSLGPTERTYLAILDEARRHGMTMTRTKVAKLLYLTDLELNRRRGHHATELRWKWLHHGPFDNALFHVEEVLAIAGVVSVKQTSNFFGAPEFRLQLEVPTEAGILDEDTLGTVVQIVERFGSLTASELKDLTYRTEPMRRAQESDAHDEELDLDVVLTQPREDLGSIVGRLRGTLQELPEQDTDPEAMDELADDIGSLAKVRSRANRELLG